MAFSLSRDPMFVSAAGWRVLALLALIGLSAGLVRDGHVFGALLAISAVSLIIFDLRRLSLGQDGKSSSAAADQTNARRLEEALALIDGVSAALFVITSDGRVRFANRAGRHLASFEPGRLQDITALGRDGAAAIRDLPPGGRRLIESSDGRALLASVQDLISPSSPPTRLVSLQSVAGELDQVQLAAWHRMSRVLAHELMNSLTPVTSLAESIRDMAASGPDPRIARAAGTIARRSAHLLAFVDRYRAVVDLPSPAPVKMSVGRLLVDLDRLIGAELRATGIDFAVHHPAKLTIVADPVLLEQALLNLIRNAAEAVRGQSRPTIRVVAEARCARAIFKVVDNGLGFDPADAETLFVPFYTTKPGGAGIGLTLAREVAAAHRGLLRAVGNKDGATFYLDLPSSEPLRT